MRKLTSSNADSPGPKLNSASATGESWNAAVKRWSDRYSARAVRDSASRRSRSSHASRSRSSPPASVSASSPSASRAAVS